MKKKRALLFDFDGVILYSEHVHQKAWDDMARYFKKNIPENFIKTNTGQTDENLANKLSILWGKAQTTSEIVDYKRKCYIKRSKTECKPISGVLEFIKKAAKNFNLAICTNSSIFDIEEDIKKYNLKTFFSLILTTESVRKHKPDPEIYLLAAKKLSEPIEKCWIFEDSLPGIRSAEKAGAKTIGITSTYASSDFPPHLPTFPDFLDQDSIWKLINN